MGQFVHVPGHFGEIAFKNSGWNVISFLGQSFPPVLVGFYHFGISRMTYNLSPFSPSFSFSGHDVFSSFQWFEVLRPNGPDGPICPARVRVHAGEKRGSSLLQECPAGDAERPYVGGLPGSTFYAYAAVS
jgi:hypothetical protein